MSHIQVSEELRDPPRLCDQQLAEFGSRSEDLFPVLTLHCLLISIRWEFFFLKMLLTTPLPKVELCEGLSVFPVCLLSPPPPIPFVPLPFWASLLLPVTSL